MAKALKPADRGIEYEMTCTFDFGEIRVVRGFLPLTKPWVPTNQTDYRKIYGTCDAK